jgi:hypothetical protein
MYAQFPEIKDFLVFVHDESKLKIAVSVLQ